MNNILFILFVFLASSKINSETLDGNYNKLFNLDL